MHATSKISVPTPHPEPVSPRPERGRHRPEHAHTVDVGILLAQHRSEKAEAQR